MPVKIKSKKGKILKVIDRDNLRNADLRDVDLDCAKLSNADLFKIFLFFSINLYLSFFKLLSESIS